ncbi:hypothetical protein AQJ43_23550 [Streptomyces avermitilis]|uniref:Uncharacterized protein n=2 Tax=Streptomyces avermitilis TaxID=33903 RepID=Q82C01_STRAW|nr:MULTISPECIES: hypothetical protein [Streptomyces]KUN52204.1 hypothetical protein AQJ43_23550 [Streptomyces avermitilis]MYT01133.1 hypothetical protein [Streptomyces sp. SID5469]OOV30748.1 hypothetical protein SM007_16225 [Streptomyces avermitilis]BAC73265.1 hypothetical protein SAVERM_5553 [Streptomyces avermitilis MA-4680 = NBRC 14893]BBJ53718.1 hypothetical protein SAVMC3_63470 [Streptomyces avermitilis]
MTIPLPAGIEIPDAVAKAQAALDAAWDRYGEAQIEYADALDDGYLERAQARDAAAAKAATLAGKPVPKGESEVSRVTALRGTGVGVIEALEQQIRAAGAVVQRAWVASLPELRERVVEALKASEAQAEEAEREYYRTRGAIRTAVSALSAVDHMERGRPGNAPVFTSSPADNGSLIRLGRDWLKVNTISVDSGDFIRVRIDDRIRELPAETAEKLISAGVAARLDDA